MLDLKFITENIDLVKQSTENKNEKADIDQIVSLDNRRKEILGEVERKKAERNKTSQEIGRLKKAGEDAGEIIAAMKSSPMKSLHLTVNFARSKLTSKRYC